MKTREYCAALYSQSGLVVGVRFTGVWVESTSLYKWGEGQWDADVSTATVAAVIMQSGHLVKRADATPSQESWLAAFERTLRASDAWLADAIEIDLQLTKAFKLDEASNK